MQLVFLINNGSPKMSSTEMLEKSGMLRKGRCFVFGTQAIYYTRDMAGWAVTKMGGGTSYLVSVTVSELAGSGRRTRAASVSHHEKLCLKTVAMF